MTGSGVLERWWAWQVVRARTARGVITTVLTGLFVVLVATTSASPVLAALVLAALSPVLWWLSWGLVGRFVPLWRRLVAGQPPAVKVGRAWQPNAGARRQLREDGNARFFVDRGGILLRRRCWFIATGTPPIAVDRATFERAVAQQPSDPVCITAFQDRTYWWYRHAIYWTNGGYAANDVKALLYARERRAQRELEHAHAVMAAAGAPQERRRDPIPRDVKLAVFTRDEGRCVECGSGFDLQYDHVIPFSMGGANTVENLQLLCARCNRAKGALL